MALGGSRFEEDASLAEKKEAAVAESPALAAGKEFGVQADLRQPLEDIGLGNLGEAAWPYILDYFEVLISAPFFEEEAATAASAASVASVASE